MSASHKWIVALAILAVACGDDKKADDDMDCPDGAVCPDASGGDGDGSGTGGTPGTGGTGGGDGDGDSDGGTGGDGDSVVDAGPTGDGDGDGGPPMDGAQNSYCEADVDCGMGLGCYTGTFVCNATCQMDDDCTALGDAYTCSTFSGVCRAECDDQTPCPAGLHCLDLGGGTQRCGYEEVVPPPAGPADATFADCADDADCPDVCSLGSCTIACGDDADCDGVAAGDGTVACSQSRSVCSITCDEGDTCPGASVCTELFQGTWRCSGQ